MSLLVFGVILPWIVVALGCWLGYQVVQQNGRILLRLEALEDRLARLASAASDAAPSTPSGLPVGSPAPPFELPDLHGTRVSLAQFLGRHVLLISWDPNCGFCRKMAPDLAALPIDGTNGRPIPLVITKGDRDQNREMVEQYGIHCTVLLQDNVAVASAYLATATPTGYLIDEHGTIASELAVGAQAVLALASSEHTTLDTQAGAVVDRNGYKEHRGTRPLEDSRLIRTGLPAGTPAPEFRLPRVDGGELSLTDYRGSRVLLVFSDPNCGPCTALAPQLERCSREAPELPIVMISRGDPDANRSKVADLGLTFPVILQRHWEISREYGMFATPIGYLVDEHGVLASDVAVGADAILALASANTSLSGASAGLRA